MDILLKLKQLFSKSSSAIHNASLTTDGSPTVEQYLRDYLFETLTEQLPDFTYEHEGNGISIQNGLLFLESRILEHTQHPNLVVLAIGSRLSSSHFSPSAIYECVAGFGSDNFDSIRSGVQNFINSTLTVIMDAMSGQHDTEPDFTAHSASWHPILGSLQVQGEWTKHSDVLNERHFFELLKIQLSERLIPQPFHWIKIYASRQPDGELVGECHFDNEPWPVGEEIIRRDTASWQHHGAFAGQKQFIMLRNRL